VTLRDGRSYHAMCAIDALGIPYMLDQPGEIQSQEPDGTEMVRVAFDPERGPTWTPAGAVTVAAFGEGCCLAQRACPHINLSLRTTQRRDTSTVTHSQGAYYRSPTLSLPDGRNAVISYAR
jgi:hypothetical protein